MPEQQNSNWEREVLGKLAMAALQEQRSARRWGIFFKILTFSYLLIVLLMFLGLRDMKNEAALAGKHTSLVELTGEISADKSANADNITEALQAAFKDKNTQGVILRINSPGGSPVQAGAINDEIRRLRAKYPDIPLYVVVEDICAYGGYYVAAAADKIYVNKASLIGSIGVLMDCFGFTGMNVLPDIGVFGSDDIVAIDTATLDAIATHKVFADGLPLEMEAQPDAGHPFQVIHGPYKDPYKVCEYGQALGLGSRRYELVDVMPVRRPVRPGGAYIPAN